MAQEPTCRIPVVGYMEKGADGKYHLIPEKSEWADIPGSVIAEFLNHLESTGEVTRKTTSKFSIITVNKYDLYQSNDKHSDKQPTSKRQTSDKEVTTVQEEKNNKEGEENKNIPTKNENGWDFSNNDEILRRFLGEDEPNE